MSETASDIVAAHRSGAATPEQTVRRTYERRAKKLGKSPWGLAVSDYFKGENLLEKG